MHRHVPYFAAALATVLAGVIASVVWAQVPPYPMGVATPVSHPALGAHPVVAVPGVQHAPAAPALPMANNANTPAQTPVQPGQTVLTPGFSVAQQVGTGGVPGVPSFTEGFGTTSPFGATGMNQPGQTPFTEGVSGNQGVGTALNQPGQPNFYDGFGFNRGVVPPNQGAVPMTPYPNYTIPPQPSNPGQANIASSVIVAAPVGFYNGFGGGQPDFGFYAGFTTPR
jgi:hypothetical protein